MFPSQFKPENYFEEEYYFKEKKYLFQELWHFVGIKGCMNLGGNRFYTTTVADKLVQFREFEGKISALENACPHRGGPFVTDEYGEQPLVCKYHGLSFKSDGSFKGTNSADWFCKDGLFNKLDCLAIKTFRVREVGEFIFVSLGDEVQFEDQFSEELISEMNKISFGSNYGRAKWCEDFNWKLNFENIKDPLHIFHVHPKTFGALLEFQGKSYVTGSGFIAGNRPNESNRTSSIKSLIDMSYFSYSSALDSPTPWWSDDIQNVYRKNSFVNFYLFPSTNFYSVGGTHFARQTYDPIGPSSFTYYLEVYLPKLRKKINAAPVIKRLLEAEKTVINEDSIILKKINDAFKSNPRTQMMHGDYEEKISEQIKFVANQIYSKKI